MKVQGHLKITNNLDMGGGQRFNDNTPSAGGTAIETDLLFGARLNWVSVTQVSIGTTAEDSSVRDSTDTLTMSWNGVLSLAITSSGAGGLDTGSEAADTWYAIFVIGDTGGTNSPAGLLSVSETSPTLPGGYDVFRRVGWIRNNASSNFLRFRQYFQKKDRLHVYDETAATVFVIDPGNLGDDVDCSSLAPPTSSVLFIRIDPDQGPTANGFGIKPKDFNQIADAAPFGPFALTRGGGGAEASYFLYDIACDSSQTLRYDNQFDDDVIIRCWGFWDHLSEAYLNVDLPA